MANLRVTAISLAIRLIITIAVVALSQLVGCQVSVEVSGDNFRCAEEPKTCPPDRICVDGACVLPGSMPDAGSTSKQRTLTVSGALGAPATNVPILVVLDSTRIDYALAGANGELLEFRDANGELEHEVALWDTGGTSHVWVRAPMLAADQTLTMRYGPLLASAARNPAVWVDHGLVLHFEDELSDSSPAALALTADGATTASGRIGSAASFDGADDYIDLGTDVATVSGSTSVTLSAWVNTMTTATTPVIEFSDSGSNSSRAFLAISNGAIPRMGVSPSDDTTTTESIDAPAITMGEWHWIVGTVDLEAATIALFVDGVLANSAGLAVADPSFPETTSAAATIGRNDTSPVGFFLGQIDEIRASPMVVDPAYVQAQYLSMTDALLAFGDEQSL